MRTRLIFLISVIAVLFLAILLIWHFRSTNRAAQSTGAAVPSPSIPASPNSPDSGVTNVYAHNLMLRKGPHFRVYIRWLRGEMVPTIRNVHPSFDHPNSFVLNILTGDLHVNVGDLNHYLNAGGIANAPLTNIHVYGNGSQVKMDGTLHKLIPIPVELAGTISATPDNRIQVHVTKFAAMKIPLKGLLKDFHVELDDLFHPAGMPGIQVTGNDIFFDTQQIFPPPHIRGQLTSIRIVNPDIVEIYGNATQDLNRVEQWRNYLRLKNGSLEFGKLTMHPVDLIMIDISSDAWFDLDLTNYQAQMVNGYTRMTPQSGLQIFMPDMDKLPLTKGNQNMSVPWVKNRNVAPPADITAKQKQNSPAHGPN